jgi:hypothetical protein
VPARRVHPCHQHPDLLLCPGQPLAARLEREHQRLLRQYFPKSPDLSVHSAEDLAVAAELNNSPRKTSAGKRPPTLGSSQQSHDLVLR